MCQHGHENQGVRGRRDGPGGVDAQVVRIVPGGEQGVRDRTAPSGALGVTVTVAVWARATMPAVADTTLISATVELREPVTTPLAFVVPPPVRVLPLPVA